jgi:hypothetical protein
LTGSTRGLRERSRREYLFSRSPRLRMNNLYISKCYPEAVRYWIVGSSPTMTKNKFVVPRSSQPEIPPLTSVEIHGGPPQADGAIRSKVYLPIEANVRPDRCSPTFLSSCRRMCGRNPKSCFHRLFSDIPTEGELWVMFIYSPLNTGSLFSTKALAPS